MENLITKEEKDHIDSICTEYKIKNYTINSDGSIDVDGDVKITNMHYTHLPLRFNIVSGDFYCSVGRAGSLTSLVGSPHSVGGNFICTHNQLTSLVGGPVTVNGFYYCYNNKLTSLEGGPLAVGSAFECSENRLSTLLGIPDVIGGHLDCAHNNLISTYSGDIDIEVDDVIYITNDNLPRLLVDNMGYIKLVLKYQRHFEIWNTDLTLNEENFQILLDEIKDGLE